MTRILITSAMLVGFAMSADIFADHVASSIRRDYEIQRVELENEYKARREANEYQFHRDRDVLRAKRARAARLECDQTRAYRMRAIHREQRALSRDFSDRNRALASRYRGEREALRDNFELALRRARFQPVAVARPVVLDRIHAHPADCECSVCSPPEPVALPAPISFEPRGACDHDGYGHDRYGLQPTSFRSPRRSIDWASLVFSLLLN